MTESFVSITVVSPRIPFAPLVVLLLFPFVPVVLHLYLIVNENMS